MRHWFANLEHSDDDPIGLNHRDFEAQYFRDTRAGEVCDLKHDARSFIDRIRLECDSSEQPT